MDTQTIIKYTLLATLLFLIWRILRSIIEQSPLSRVPGPRKASWWKGKLCYWSVIDVRADLRAGNFDKVFDRRGWDYHREITEKYGGAVRISALLGDEQLLVTDPLALHHIFVKDQYVYEVTDAFVAMNYLALGTCLLSTLGDHHRRQRKLLNPVFNLKHMRDLLPIFYPIAYRLRDIISERVKSGNDEFNNMKWLSRAALEYIGQAGLGHMFHVMDESKKTTYSDVLKLMNPTLFSLILYRQFLPYMVKIGSPNLRRKIVEMLPSKRVQKITWIFDTMDAMARRVYKEKVDAIEQGNEEVMQQVGKGKDILSALLKANLDAKEEDRLPKEEIVAQVNMFIIAGHDTTTSAVTRLLHTLSEHPEAQSKLREEILAARKVHGEFDYDTLMALPYLDAVCRETLRLYPPVTIVNRTTRKDIVLPLAWPIRFVDGQEMKEIPLKKNTNVIVSILRVNRNKKIWGPDAEEWKPERWLKPLPESVGKAHMPGVYASMMTFIGGGRACIGFKFAEMELKIVTSILIENFVFSPGSEDIYWYMGGLQIPVAVKSDPVTPQLPVKIALYEPNA